LVRAGLPQPEELKAAADAALQRLKQDAESKGAALRAAQSRHSGSDALLKSARSQLQTASEECAGLQHRIQEGLRRLYDQARHDCHGLLLIVKMMIHFPLCSNARLTVFRG